MTRAKAHVRFFASAIIVALVAIVGFDVVSRVVVADKALRLAFSETLRVLGAQPVDTLVLFLPFAAVGVLAAETTKASRMVPAVTLFALSVAALWWLYFSGFMGGQHALLERKWTAAALSVGLLPFTSIPIVFVAALVAGFVAWRYRAPKT